MSDKFGEGRDPYLYPGLKVMRNRLGIRQAQRLEQAAWELTALRAATIELGPLVRGLPHLCAIHRQIYQDVFDWAGQLREVDIYQGDTRFCHFAYIEKEGNALLQDLEEEGYLVGLAQDKFIERLAHYYCEINVLFFVPGAAMILLIDNYDSFTWNLYQYFCELGAEVLVRRNDELTLADIISLAPAKIVISPGPCTPDESGISLAAIRHFSGQTPILGVCLGHQAIAQVFGAAIVRAAKVMHGKTSPVSHTGQGVFLGLNNPLTVTRYHSLLIDPLTLPECFEVTARSEEGEIMGIRHRVFDLEGVQFHPESILSEQGHQLLANFLNR